MRHAERLDLADKAAWYRSPASAMYPGDCPITEAGKQHAATVSRAFPDMLDPDIRFCAVVTSPFIRCVQTAVEVCRTLDLPLCVDQQIGEIFGPHCFGPWAPPGPRRRTPEEVYTYVPPDVKLLGLPKAGVSQAKGFLGDAPAWGETVADARMRMVQRVGQYVARVTKMGGAGIILVTHGDCVASCLGLTLAASGSAESVEKVGYCAYAVLQRSIDADAQHMSLVDDPLSWFLQHGNVRIGTNRGKDDRGPLDPRPLGDELDDVIEAEAEASSCRVSRRKSTNLLLQMQICRAQARDGIVCV